MGYKETDTRSKSELMLDEDKIQPEEDDGEAITELEVVDIVDSEGTNALGIDKLELDDDDPEDTERFDTDKVTIRSASDATGLTDGVDSVTHIEAATAGDVSEVYVDGGAAVDITATVDALVADIVLSTDTGTHGKVTAVDAAEVNKGATIDVVLDDTIGVDVVTDDTKVVADPGLIDCDEEDKTACADEYGTVSTVDATVVDASKLTDVASSIVLSLVDKVNPTYDVHSFKILSSDDTEGAVVVVVLIILSHADEGAVVVAALINLLFDDKQGAVELVTLIILSFDDKEGALDIIAAFFI